MKKAALLLCGIMTILITSQAQNMRYFEFFTDCGHGNWQDTSFIAATNDQAVIDAVLAQLSLQKDQRDRFISGTIAYGNDGYNNNAGHRFRWHFVPGEWDLTEFAMEVCDGCPYSDLDSDTSYWVGLIGSYCPWSGFPSREVDVVSGRDEYNPLNALLVFPNPASDKVTIDPGVPLKATVRLMNAVGATVALETFSGDKYQLDLSGLSPGLYILQVENGVNSVHRKLFVE